MLIYSNDRRPSFVHPHFEDDCYRSVGCLLYSPDWHKYLMMLVIYQLIHRRDINLEYFIGILRFWNFTSLSRGHFWLSLLTRRISTVFIYSAISNTMQRHLSFLWRRFKSLHVHLLTFSPWGIGKVAVLLVFLKTVLEFISFMLCSEVLFRAPFLLLLIFLLAYNVPPPPEKAQIFVWRGNWTDVWFLWIGCLNTSENWIIADIEYSRDWETWTFTWLKTFRMEFPHEKIFP